MTPRRLFHWFVVLLFVPVLLASCGVADAAAQAVEVESGVEPREVTVGDRFRSVVRIHAPPGTTVEFPASLGGSEVVEDLAPVQVLGGEGEDHHTAIYTLAAWQVGRLPEPVATVVLRLPGGEEHRLNVAVPMPTVRSVLPVDTAGVEPRVARGILPAEPAFPWWIVLLTVMLLVGAGLVAWRMRRRMPEGVPLAFTASPREAALAELDRARRAGLVEAGEWKPFFSQVSEALRGYLDSVSPRWSADQTTGELLHTLRRDGIAGEQAERIETVLVQADLVKFARMQPSAVEAEACWRTAREVVETLHPADPHSDEVDSEAAAVTARPQLAASTRGRDQ